MEGLGYNVQEWCELWGMGWEKNWEAVVGVGLGE